MSTKPPWFKMGRRNRSIVPITACDLYWSFSQAALEAYAVLAQQLGPHRNHALYGEVDHVKVDFIDLYTKWVHINLDTISLPRYHAIFNLYVVYGATPLLLRTVRSIDRSLIADIFLRQATFFPSYDVPQNEGDEERAALGPGGGGAQATVEEAVAEGHRRRLRRVWAEGAAGHWRTVPAAQAARQPGGGGNSLQAGPTSTFCLNVSASRS